MGQRELFTRSLAAITALWVAGGELRSAEAQSVDGHTVAADGPASFVPMPGRDNEVLLFSQSTKNDDVHAVVSYLQNVLGVNIGALEKEDAYTKIPSVAGNNIGFVRNYGIKVGDKVLWRGNIKDSDFPSKIGLEPPIYLEKAGDGGEAIYDSFSKTLFASLEDIGLVPRNEDGSPLCGSCLIELSEEGDKIVPHIIYDPSENESLPEGVNSRAAASYDSKVIGGIRNESVPNKLDPAIWQANARILYNQGVRQLALLSPTSGYFYDADLMFNFLPDGTPVINSNIVSPDDLKVFEQATAHNPSSITLDTKPGSRELVFKAEDDYLASVGLTAVRNENKYGADYYPINPQKPVKITYPQIMEGLKKARKNAIRFSQDWATPEYVDFGADANMFYATGFEALPVQDNQGRQVIMFTYADEALRAAVNARGYHVVTLQDIGKWAGREIIPGLFGDGTFRCTTLRVQSTRPLPGASSAKTDEPIVG